MSRLDVTAGALDKIAVWSLYVIIFALPFSKSLIEIFVVIGLVSALTRKTLIGERLFKLDAVNILLCVYLAASLPSLLNTPDLSLSVRAFFSKSLKFAALFLLAREVIDSREKLKNFITIAMLSCVIILADGLIQYHLTNVDLLHNYPSFKFVATNPFYPGAPTASFPYPNDYAAWMLVFIFPIMTYIFLSKAPWPRIAFTGLVSVALFYSFFIAKVRGAWFSFLIAFCLMLTLKASKLMLIALAVILIAAFFTNDSFVSYVTSFSSLHDRGKMWEYSWEIFKRHPVIGNGLNTFYINYMNIREDESRGVRGSYAHNCYMQMAADIGIVGLVSFAAFVFAIILKGIRSFKKARDPFYGSLVLGITLGITAFLIHSSVDTNLYSLPLAALFWLASGVLLSAIRISEKIPAI